MHLIVKNLFHDLQISRLEILKEEDLNGWDLEELLGCGVWTLWVLESPGI